MSEQDQSHEGKPAVPNRAIDVSDAMIFGGLLVGSVGFGIFSPPLGVIVFGFGNIALGLYAAGAFCRGPKPGAPGAAPKAGG